MVRTRVGDHDVREWPNPVDGRLGVGQNLKSVSGRYIRDLIFGGYLRRGERIDQDAVAKQLGVSKLPIREALIELSAAGLVDLPPRRGAYVADISEEDLIDHYRIYGAISALATERAAKTLSDEQFESLERSIDGMRDASTGKVREEINRTFHQMINRAGGSRRLRIMLRGLESMMFAEFHGEDIAWNETAVSDHARILALLRERDGAVAAREMQQHVERGGTKVIKRLKSEGFWEA
jgi:DNA-binding GntR family transcriptional regulator